MPFGWNKTKRPSTSRKKDSAEAKKEQSQSGEMTAMASRWETVAWLKF